MGLAFAALAFLIGGILLVLAATIPVRAWAVSRWRAIILIPPTILLMSGIAGFFGSAISALGGLSWLGPSFEWPVGYSSNIAEVSGTYVVPHSPSGRVQLYDAEWNFKRGWHVDANGGLLWVFGSEDDRINVITARGNWHYEFNLEGNLLGKRKYNWQDRDKFTTGDIRAFVPTRWWLLGFTHPFAAWLVAVVGGILVALASPRSRRSRVEAARIAT